MIFRLAKQVIFRWNKTEGVCFLTARVCDPKTGVRGIDSKYLVLNELRKRANVHMEVIFSKDQLSPDRIREVLCGVILDLCVFYPVFNLYKCIFIIKNNPSTIKPLYSLMKQRMAKWNGATHKHFFLRFEALDP